MELRGLPPYVGIPPFYRRFATVGTNSGTLRGFFLASFQEKFLKETKNDYHHIFPWESPPMVIEPSWLMLSLVIGAVPPPALSKSFR